MSVFFAFLLLEKILIVASNMESHSRLLAVSLAWQSILDLYVSRRIYLSRSPLMTCSGLSSIAYPRNIASIRMPCSTATTKTRNSVRSAKGF